MPDSNSTRHCRAMHPARLLSGISRHAMSACHDAPNAAKGAWLGRLTLACLQDVSQDSNLVEVSRVQCDGQGLNATLMHHSGHNHNTESSNLSPKL